MDAAWSLQDGGTMDSNMTVSRWRHAADVDPDGGWPTSVRDQFVESPTQIGVDIAEALVERKFDLFLATVEVAVRIEAQSHLMVGCGCCDLSAYDDTKVFLMWDSGPRSVWKDKVISSVHVHAEEFDSEMLAIVAEDIWAAMAERVGKLCAGCDHDASLELAGFSPNDFVLNAVFPMIDELRDIDCECCADGAESRHAAAVVADEFRLAALAPSE
jgi:hypothetical protein